MSSHGKRGSNAHRRNLWAHAARKPPGRSGRHTGVIHGCERIAGRRHDTQRTRGWSATPPTALRVRGRHCGGAPAQCPCLLGRSAQPTAKDAGRAHVSAEDMQRGRRAGAKFEQKGVAGRGAERRGIVCRSGVRRLLRLQFPLYLGLGSGLRCRRFLRLPCCPLHNYCCRRCLHHFRRRLPGLGLGLRLPARCLLLQPIVHRPPLSKVRP